jgi:hypothetical protein
MGKLARYGVIKVRSNKSLTPFHCCWGDNFFVSIGNPMMAVLSDFFFLKSNLTCG